ncbi:MAG: 3-dehydroquinate synthase [Clostridia bacterium]|nr:3-dehydroquinate synthase [Clostridia bacterium]
MKSVRVNASTPYEVVIGSGVSAKIGEYMQELGRSGKVMIVSDTNVAPLYAEGVADQLVYHGYEPTIFTFDAGEESKNLSTYGDILALLAEEGFTRTDTVLALGGGVVGDMAGFAAATYMRGVAFINMPTSLLAAIDSSVGGKTAVDLPQGKNLVGAFYQPRLVLFDTDFIKTLPYDEIRNGLGEGVKYAVLEGGEIFDILSSGLTSENLEDFIALSVDAKRRIVEADEWEKGKRKLLNLGHTVAHAVETLTEYVVPHGVAVAYGVRVMSRLAHDRGELSDEDYYKIEELLLENDLGLELNPVEELIPYFSADKKKAGRTLTLVTIAGIGDCRLTEINIEDVMRYFEGN